jgi:adenine-specific DNA-methyltransferase
MAGKVRGTGRPQKKVTRYDYPEAREQREPETGHTSLLGAEHVVTVPMDGGAWAGSLDLQRVPENADQLVVVDMDPAVDPVLLWCGKRSRRDIAVLPLQRNEVVAESRIARIVDRARQSTARSPDAAQGSFFAELEKELREGDKDKRVEFYTHDEGWKNKLICGDSLTVMESLLEYEGLRGRVQMIYIDPPYGIKYDANFQQRIDSIKNEPKDHADDVLTIKAFRDTWALGVHSYLSYLQERLYVCRELLADSGSVFVQMGEDNLHLARILLDEVFGKSNYISEVVFLKTSGKGGGGLDAVYDTLLWYAKSKEQVKYQQLYRPRPPHTLSEQYTLVELADGTVRKITDDESAGIEPLPQDARRFMPDQLSSQGESQSGSEQFDYEGHLYDLPPNTHWKTSREGLERLAAKGRLYPIGKRLRYRRYTDDFPFAPFTNVWDDTVISGFGAEKLYAVQTSSKVLERCILMTTEPGDLVFDPTCGSGTTIFAAEKLGRRWVTCDTSRVAVNIARRRLLSGVFEHYRTRAAGVSSGFIYETAEHLTLKSLAYDMEPEKVDLVDLPEVDPSAVRVTGPFEVATLGRYSVEDWKGYVVGVGADAGKLENYIGVICRLYRKGVSLPPSGGLIHAVIEDEGNSIGISVGPISGRVTVRQIHEAAIEARQAGLNEVHVLGWAFETNANELTAKLEADNGVAVRLMMIRPDTLTEGLKATQPEQLFSPLAVPDVEIVPDADGQIVLLKGVAIFDRKRRITEYMHASSGYVAAWYLDEDYDGDCFVDCQMFFDFKKKPAIERTLGIEVEPEEWTLRTESDPFAGGTYRRVAIKVVDVFGNESTTVKLLASS